ncbi:tetratricopeptide repeat protein, partial [bacterium]|nr:tetratricopeptide repeat protein [bacterium]
HSDSVRKYPENLQARLSLGSYYLNNERYDDAITHLKKAVELHPRRGEARLFLGMAYYRNKLYAKAIKELEFSLTMVDFDKLPYEVFTALGNSYIIEGRLNDAEGAFKEALRLAPNKLLYGQISDIISGIIKKNHEVEDNGK